MIKGIRILDEEEISFGKVLKKLNFMKWENKLKKLEFNTEQIMSLKFFPTKYIKSLSIYKKPKQVSKILEKIYKHKNS